MHNKCLSQCLNKKKSNGRKEEIVMEVVTGVYKLHLHCQQCAHAIRKTLMRTEGVQKVDIDVEIGKISVKGKIDPVKIHEHILNVSRRKVELISPIPKKVEHNVEKKVEKKEAVIKTTTLKIDMHCENCGYQVKSRLLELEGVHTVKINIEKQTCIVEGTSEPEKLVKYLHKKLRKHVEVLEQKEHKEKKEEKDRVKKSKEKEEDDRNVIVPYIIHHGYPPQLFSDENPNSCNIL